MIKTEFLLLRNSTLAISERFYIMIVFDYVVPHFLSGGMGMKSQNFWKKLYLVKQYLIESS